MIFGGDGGKWYGDDYYAISYHIELNKKLPCVFELCIKKRSVLFAYTTIILQTS